MVGVLVPEMVVAAVVEVVPEEGELDEMGPWVAEEGFEILNGVEAVAVEVPTRVAAGDPVEVTRDEVLPGIGSPWRQYWWYPTTRDRQWKTYREIDRE
ncbi:uncharacterized protein A1O5_06559 [Cladophialophora psammophila CBS 110553]|uniref:Uncharacterized protein n=1 Tax=Cladophialophora psammophila CBS 110553 TaxID=1182543 RepID=W9WZJ7_9EURO|nr:uncharacterized protein A1O5_06559 [Cladophialophora psammophila CBS 110553]EXJ70490.1 hypothetical protein A1O5_06559 [Cladophialophora psammophila CBS 110553]